jgi:hypothetical protein
VSENGRDTEHYVDGKRGLRALLLYRYLHKVFNLPYPVIILEYQIHHMIPSLFAINKLSGMKQGGKRFIEKWHV